MPNTARLKSSTGIYHVMIRGNNKQIIFRDHEDYLQLIDLLKQKLKNNSFALYAWCLMPNHVHLLIKEKQESLSSIFESILSAFVSRYNRKYRMVGHLFQGRFKSQPVEDETYFLRAVRYIHRNPIDANLCEKMEYYPYSSFSWYFRSGRFKDDDMIFHLIRKDEFEQFHQEKDQDDVFLDIDDSQKLTEEEIINLVSRTGQRISEVKFLPRDQRKQIIRMLLLEDVSYRQINRLTGISMSSIRAVSRELHQE